MSNSVGSAKTIPSATVGGGIANVLTREARCADLVMIGQKPGPGNDYQTIDPGEAILKMGRPTLVVPEKARTLRAEHVVLGWKDTREARRALRDALPFLQRATRVTIVEARGEGEEATALGRLDDEGSGAAQRIEIAQEERADLVVRVWT